MCWRICWWPESGRYLLEQFGPPGCSCICRLLTEGDPGTHLEIDSYSDYKKKNTTVRIVVVTPAGVTGDRETRELIVFTDFSEVWV